MSDSATCTHMGLTCVDILSVDCDPMSGSCSGGWSDLNLWFVCDTMYGYGTACDNVAGLADESCSLTCAKIQGSSYWEYHRECMVALVVEEQCTKCSEGKYGTLGGQSCPFDSPICSSGYWAALDSCQPCNDLGMTSLAGGFSQNACVCNAAYLTIEETGASHPTCASCGENRVLSDSSATSISSWENCQCNAGYAGSDRSQRDNSLAYYWDYISVGCTACPAGKYKESASSVTSEQWNTWISGCESDALIAYEDDKTMYSSSSVPLTDSTTCTHMGLMCVDILSFDCHPILGSCSGGWGDSDPWEVCHPNGYGKECDNWEDSGTPAWQACSATCAKIPGSTYWQYYNECMGALAIEEQCTGCKAETFSTAIGATSSTTCIKCPVSSTQSPSQTSCLCNAGYSGDGAAYAPCAARTYKNATGSALCIVCSTRTYGITQAAVSSGAHQFL